MEELNLYDNSGKLLERTILRGDKNLKDCENIKLTVVWLQSKDKFLIQKCSVQKGGEFAATGGHVSRGNTSSQQAVIEVYEELGLTIEENKLKFLGNIFRPHAIFDVYLYLDDNLMDKPITLQKDEVENFYWLTKFEIISLIDQGKMRTSSSEHFFKFIYKS